MYLSESPRLDDSNEYTQQDEIRNFLKSIPKY